MSSFAKGFLAVALTVGLSIGGFVLGSAVRYQWNSSGGMEDFWLAGVVGAGIGFVAGVIASALVVSKGRSQRKGSRLTP
jgi:pilus assembly protein TadC